MRASSLLVSASLLATAGALPGCRRTTPSPRRLPPPLFSDATSRAGIRFQHRNGQGKAATIVETTGTGCAFLDYDNDGWLDVYLVNGKSPPGDGNHLYHNEGNGTFTDVTARAGVSGLGHGFGMGCAVGDYDGDGFQDLYVTYFGTNVLYHNRGDGTFADATSSAGVATGGFSTAATLSDLDGDGRPDLYVARYCRFDRNSMQLCTQRGVSLSCPPYYYPPISDKMYRNLGNGTFADVTAQWGMAETSGRGLGVIAVDYNGDGRLDLFVANDGSPNFLYRNLGGGKFREVATPEGIGLTDIGSSVANMGCDFGDFAGEGTFGAVTGVFQNEVHPIWKYQKGQGFTFVSGPAGIRDAATPYLTFGIGFADLDNDGWLDLMMANGHVQDHVAELDKNCSYPQSRLFFANSGHGAFLNRTSEAGPAITTPSVGRGLAFGDYDNDGRVDLLVNNNNGAAMLIHNEHPARNWVALRLIGRGTNWEANGAVVRLAAGGRTQTSFVHTNYSFASACDPRVHFGLGDATRVTSLEIRWPDGTTSHPEGVPVNRISTILEPGAHPPASLRRLAEPR